MISYLSNWTKENKVITALFFVFLTEIICYFIFAPPLMIMIYTAVFILLALGASFLFKNCSLTNIFKINWKIFSKKNKVNYNYKPLLFCLAISMVFYILYIILGMLLTQNYDPHELEQLDLFGSDYPGWLDMEWIGMQKASHPLLILFLTPFWILKIFSPPISRFIAATIINSFFGSLGLFFASLFFWKFTQKYQDTLLLTILFGLTMSQIFYSSLPESYALGGASIIPTYLLLWICLSNQKFYLGYWILAGLFSFGVTITNFSQTIICFVILIFALDSKHKITSILEYIGMIFLMSFILSLIQNILFDGEYFFMPQILRDTKHIESTILQDPILVFQELFKHFFLVNFVSANPFPESISLNEKISLNFFERDLRYTWLGLISISCWLGLFVTGFYHNGLSLIKKAINIPGNIFLIAVILVNLCNLVFYAIFNIDEMFLFTCNFTFPILLLALNKSTFSKNYFKLVVLLTIVLMGLNNLIVMGQIISLLTSVPG